MSAAATTMSVVRIASRLLLGYRQAFMVESGLMRQIRLSLAWIAGSGPRPKLRPSLVAAVLGVVALGVGGAVLLSSHGRSTPQGHSAARAPTPSTAPSSSPPSSTRPLAPRTTTPTTAGPPKALSTTPTTQALAHRARTARHAKPSKSRSTQLKIGRAKRHSHLKRLTHRHPAQKPNVGTLLD